MKRFHVHIAVEDLTRSIAFYSELFGMQPTIARPDYAKWMIEESAGQFRDFVARSPARRQSPGLPGRGFGRAGGVGRTRRSRFRRGRAQRDRSRMLLRQGQQVLGDRSLKGLHGSIFKRSAKCLFLGQDTILDPDAILGADAATKPAAEQACCIPLHNAAKASAAESKAACCVPIASPDPAQPVKAWPCC